MKNTVFQIRVSSTERKVMHQVASERGTTVAAIIRQAFNLPSAIPVRKTRVVQ